MINVATSILFLRKHIVSAVSIGAGIVLLFGASTFYVSYTARAQVALFYPTTCLGGWKNTEAIIGRPDVIADNGASYTDQNSATVVDSVTQLFCGGFKGTIPQDAVQEKVVLKFSWHMEEEGEVIMNTLEATSTEGGEEFASSTDEGGGGMGGSDSSSEGSAGEGAVETEGVDHASSSPDVDNVDSASSTSPTEVLVPESPLMPTDPEPSSSPDPEAIPEPQNEEVEVKETAVPEAQGEETKAEESVPEVQEPEPITEPAPVSFLNALFPIARAEEYATTSEGAEEVLPVDDLATPISATSTKLSEVEELRGLDGYFEVLYTLDGEEWRPLGVVSSIDNEVSFEIPSTAFHSIADLGKVQISLQTLSSFDKVPKIYLDSLWLEVGYTHSLEDPLPPPGSKEGDVIYSETVYEDLSAVVVLRDTGVKDMSELFDATSSSTNVSSSLSATTSVLEAAATNTEPIASSTLSISSSTLASLAHLSDTRIELWLRNLSSSEWERVADDTMLSRSPRVQFVEGHIFWFGADDDSVWRFSPRSHGYDSVSFSGKEKPSLPFASEAGEARRFFLDAQGEAVFEDVKPLNKERVE